MQHPEHRQQVIFFQIMSFLSDIPETGLTFAVPNGARIISTRHAALVKAEGMKKGVPDILCAFSRRGFTGLAIEMKIPPNKLTPDQKKFQQYLEAEGWLVVHECPSAAEAFETWASYIQLDDVHTDRVLANFFPERLH